VIISVSRPCRTPKARHTGMPCFRYSDLGKKNKKKEVQYQYFREGRLRYTLYRYKKLKYTGAGREGGGGGREGGNSVWSGARDGKCRL
jgi:hypothetical protein